MYNMLPLEIEELIMKYRGNIQPPHFFIYNHYLKIQKLHEEIAEIERYFQREEDEMFATWYCGDYHDFGAGYMPSSGWDLAGNCFSHELRAGNWDIAGNYVE